MKTIYPWLMGGILLIAEIIFILTLVVRKKNRENK